MTTAKKKIKVPKPEDLTDKEIEILIQAAMEYGREKEAKVFKSYERMVFFINSSPRLFPVIANEAWLMLKHLKALGVTPSYGKKTKAQPQEGRKDA